MNTEITMKEILSSSAFAQEDCEQTLSWFWSVFPSQTLVMSHHREGLSKKWLVVRFGGYQKNSSF